MDGERDVLGMWVGPTGGEGAKFWMTVLTELRNRGVADVLIVCCDGLKGFTRIDPGDVAAGRRAALCRASRPLACVTRRKKYWGQVCRDLREIYTAPTLTPPRPASWSSPTRWRDQYPAMIATWETAWAEFVPFLDFPVELRKIVYTTNAIECLNARFRKAVRHRRPLPERASRVESALPRRHRQGTEPGQPDRPRSRLENILNALTIHYGDRIQAAN